MGRARRRLLLDALFVVSMVVVDEVELYLIIMLLQLGPVVMVWSRWRAGLAV